MYSCILSLKNMTEYSPFKISLTAMFFFFSFFSGVLILMIHKLTGFNNNSSKEPIPFWLSLRMALYNWSRKINGYFTSTSLMPSDCYWIKCILNTHAS